MTGALTAAAVTVGAVLAVLVFRTDPEACDERDHPGGDGR